MRNTVIPAQITTVEDKIAGNLNLTQILLLMMPVFVTTILFAFVPPTMKLGILKIVISGILLISCGILAIRVKGRVVLNWLLVWAKFKIRPSYYVFNKNDNYLREVEQIVKTTNKVKVIKKISVKEPKKALVEIDAVKLLHVITDQKNSLSFVFNQKGGLHVAVEPIKK
jgi:hypothetical protein